ncbi:hypothetical protein NPIL_66131 [Nephila pilipes]|uniref:Uncharacterized protein n=1 Tax=Nephila pilipes TaxID=299642 RepID=A0A8X6U6E3_NEPPI|nr:hypothetical protein NPIL_66131 [Nephila pilipes]
MKMKLRRHPIRDAAGNEARERCGVHPGALLLRSTVSSWTTPGVTACGSGGDPSLIGQPWRILGRGDAKGEIEDGCSVWFDTV